MINKKKEGGFYASKVRLFLNEYDGIPLEEFCKAEKVSYNKMLNCLGRTNHQYHPVGKPKSDKPIKAVEPDRPLLPDLELKELVIDMPEGQERIHALCIMEKNEYLCNMNKAEEQQFAILSSRVSSAEREKHEAQKKARLLEQQNSVLESEKADMQRQLNEKIGEVAETVKQMAQFMMGKGPVTLSDSLRDAIVAVDEYPCLLNALQDGTLDFSNNRCERQIRRLAKYRNNSFFTGSPEASKRLARLLSHFANCKDHHLDSFTYLCDVFRRINKTAKDELVNLLEHKWQPMPAMALA